MVGTVEKGGKHIKTDTHTQMDIKNWMILLRKALTLLYMVSVVWSPNTAAICTAEILFNLTRRPQLLV